MSAGRVTLQPRRARPFYGRHPWVYPGAIAAVEGDPADGAAVGVVEVAPIVGAVVVAVVAVIARVPAAGLRCDRRTRQAAHSGIHGRRC